MNAYRDGAGRPRALGPEIGQGGEGTVFAVADDARLCAKIFPPRRAAERAAKLRAMVERRPSRALALRGSVAWPVELLYRAPDEVAGYLMPTVRDGVELHRYLVPDERAQFAGWYSLRDLHELAATLADAVAAVHAARHCIGDLKPQNVLVAPRSGRVTLVDADSFQVLGADGEVHPCPVITPEYAAPELHGRAGAAAPRTPASDAFALAVLVYQILLGGSHPFEGEGEGRVTDRIPRGLSPILPSTRGVRAPTGAVLFATLHPALQEAFRRCFGDGHAATDQRLPAQAWRDVLRRASRDLVRCVRSAAHEHPRPQRECPWCERRTRTGFDLFPGGQRWQRRAHIATRAEQPAATRRKWLTLHVRGRMIEKELTPAERRWLEKVGAALSFRRAEVEAVIRGVAAAPVVSPWTTVVSRAHRLLPHRPRPRALLTAAALACIPVTAARLGTPSASDAASEREEPAPGRTCVGSEVTARIGNTGGQGAFLRDAPSIMSGKIGLAEGTLVRLTGQSVVAEHLRWSEVSVDDAGDIGWVAERYLVLQR